MTLVQADASSPARRQSCELIKFLIHLKAVITISSSTTDSDNNNNTVLALLS